jgi:Arc/MetJ-type ribon-helix-helix transcriptional regulator
MNSSSDDARKQQKGGKMVTRTVSMELNLWDEARRKVGLYGSLSEVIRKLLRLWIAGKINLDDYEDEL